MGGDGFLLMYKRLDNGAFNWQRSKDEAIRITEEQYRMLMQGLEVIARHPIEEIPRSSRWHVVLCNSPIFKIRNLDQIVFFRNDSVCYPQIDALLVNDTPVITKMGCCCG